MNKVILMDIFKAYDVRGKVGKQLNNNVAIQIGKALAYWLPKSGIVAVGRDMRPDSQELSQAIIKGLNDQGRNVLDIGEVTSEMIYFAAGKYNMAGGVMVTASHNPGEYNGIKFCQAAARPVGMETGLFDIRDLAINTSFKPANKKGSVKEKDISSDWIKHVLSFIDVSKIKPLNIVVDAGNGMAGKIFPKIEPYLPIKVQEMYFELDGTFPNHVANPLDPKNLVDIKKSIAKSKADGGIAFDGDGDRAVFIDEKGQTLNGSVMTALLADYFLSRYGKETIISNAVNGKIVDDVVKKHGGKLIRSRVGHSYIKDSMNMHKAIFAGEYSGHYYFRDNYNADSGLIAAMIALYILSASGKKLSELVDPYRNAYFQIEEANFEVEDKQAMIDSIAKALSSMPQDRLDGLTVSYPTGWLNVRPSNTEPLLRLTAESSSKKELNKMVTEVKSLIIT